MNQSGVMIHEEMQDEINPFGIQLEGPLLNQVAAGKRAPKRIDDGDIGKAGSIFGGGG